MFLLFWGESPCGVLVLCEHMCSNWLAREKGASAQLRYVERFKKEFLFGTRMHIFSGMRGLRFLSDALWKIAIFVFILVRVYFMFVFIFLYYCFYHFVFNSHKSSRQFFNIRETGSAWSFPVSFFRFQPVSSWLLRVTGSFRSAFKTGPNMSWQCYIAPIRSLLSERGGQITKRSKPTRKQLLICFFYF